MPDTLDSLHREFAAYRQAHRRGAYPLHLRRRAVDALNSGQLLQFAARLGLTASQVARWEGKAKTHEPQGFFEIRPNQTPQATPAPAYSLEVEMRSGATLRLRGELQPQLLAVVIEALQRAGT